MDDIDLFKQTFFQECADLLGGLENQLTAIQGGSRDVELLHEAFRAIHSIKGGAGAFGFKRLIAFAHTMETVFDLMRDGRIALGEDLLVAAIRASDILSDLVKAAEAGEELPEGYENCAASDLAVAVELAGDVGLSALASTPAQSADPAEEPVPETPVTYRIEFRPKFDMLRRASEPLLIVRQLKELGSVTATADLSGLPTLDELDPTDAVLAWSFELESAAGLSAVQEVFEFVEDDCHLSIMAQENVAGDAAKAAVSQPLQPSAASAAMEPLAPRAVTTSSIRVDLERVDRLVNLVGEIVIGQAMVSQQIDDGLLDSHPKLLQELTLLLQHTHNLQESVMAIRAQPVRSIFARMPRVVRDLSEQTGKKVRIETTGENTEIDKTVIEQLNDPLTHMIRNAVDHGIESPEDRIAAGKPEEGLIRLSAEQHGSRIVVQLSDDGQGINRDRVRQIAIAKELIASDATLSDEEIDNLIFLPGFSTAEEVSSISGRGVGMDVVNQNIRKLGGRVSVRSEPGKGSTVLLTLPLTLAVLEGMVVRAGDESFIIPLTNIIESLLLNDDQVNQVAGSGRVALFRGEYLKLIDLKEAFNIPASDDTNSPLGIVVEVEDGSLVSLVVDEILGQQQVVIKSLEENFDSIPGIAGATILGDGEVALILDVTAVRDLQGGKDSRNSITRMGSIRLQETGL